MTNNRISFNNASVIPGKVGSTNRGYDNEIKESDAPELLVTLEKINTILMTYFSDVISPTIDDNGTLKPVPVLYGTEERWKTVRADGYLRDVNSGKLQTPLIVIRRSEMRKGVLMNPLNKYLHTTLDTGWNARNAYDKFAVQNKIKPSQQLRYVVIPDYMDLTYDGYIWTEYQQQMDAVLEQINVENEEYWGEKNNFKFRVNIDSFTTESDLPSDGDRIIRVNFQMRVAAYLLPERMIKNMKISSTTQKMYTAKKVTTFIETVDRIKNSD